jgi:hypothetical protein
MILIAHILGMPVEELLTPSMSGIAAGMLLSIASVIATLRRRSLE